MENLISMGFSCIAEKPEGKLEQFSARPASHVVLHGPVPDAVEEPDIDFQDVTARIESALTYVSYLNKGGKAFDDVSAIARTSPDGRLLQWQSLHDNLLGELNAGVLHARIVDSPAKAPAQWALTREGMYQLYAGLAGDVLERPYYDGYGSCDVRDTCCACLAFDYAKGWVRSDYVQHVPQGCLAEAAVRDGLSMWGGSKGGVLGFTVARHLGAGLELALKARTDQGEDCPIAADDSGVVRYLARAGSAADTMPWGASPRWFVDFSVTSVLKGAKRSLDEFRLILSIDANRGSDTKVSKRFILTKPCVLYHPAIGEMDIGRAWLLTNDKGQLELNKDGTLFGGFGDEVPESVGGFVSQGSVNLGFRFLRRLLAGNGGSSDERVFGPGQFGIRLEAFDRCGALLIDNYIQVCVQ